MPRVTEEERKRFHKILDDSVDKMNRPKNAEKCHWKYITATGLQKMINVENAELDLAIHGGYSNPFEVAEEENFDLINLNLMMVDNLRKNI